MEFPVGRSDLVRAINQRWLLKFWTRHAGPRTVPLWRVVESEDLSRLSANLSLLHLTGHNGDSRLRIVAHGATLGQVYGSADCRGKYLDEVHPKGMSAASLMPFHRAVQSERPVYTIQDVTDRAGRSVQVERLILPFSSNGQIVDRILASFEYICVDGAFDSQGLMLTQSAPPVLKLSATITTADAP